MTDFKIIMTPQNPTPQRVAAAFSLKELAPRKFATALRDKNFVPFIEGVQRNWRNWLSTMKKAGYAALDSKKFGYARNCPPVLVSSAVDGAVGPNVRLVPCRLPACPFCHARSVMKVQKSLAAAISNFEECDIKFDSCDRAATSLLSCVESLDSLWDDQSTDVGSISKRVFWFEDDADDVSPPLAPSPTPTLLSYMGRLSCIQINPTWRAQLPYSRFYFAYDMKKESLNAEMGVIAKYIGNTFSYPSRLLYLLGDTEALSFAHMLNMLHKNKQRFYRTTGVCRQNHTAVREDKAATWRENFSKQLDVVLAELSDIKEILHQHKGNNDGV